MQRQVTSVSLPAFICPSGPKAEPVLDGGHARGNYAGNNGLGPMEDSVPAGSAYVVRERGVFYLNSRTFAADVRDGLSNTAFVAEIIAVSGFDMRGVLHYPEGPLYHYNDTPNSPMPDEIRAGWCVSTPDAPCDGSLFNSWIPKMITMTARSDHPGGVNLLFGDGSVHFANNSIALGVWQAIGTPAGNEVRLRELLRLQKWDESMWRFGGKRRAGRTQRKGSISLPLGGG